MWKLALIIAITVLSTELGSCFAQNPEIKLIDKTEKNLSPGSTYNLIVQLCNPSQEAVEFSLKMKTPPGWTQLVEYTSIKVDSAENQLKVLPFHIIESAKVGAYEIIIEGFNRVDGRKIGEVKVPVFIVPKYELLVQTIEATKYVSAGDTLSATFIISNLSNIEVDVNLTTLKKGQINSKTVHLMSDSTMRIRVPVTAYENQSQYARQSVSLTSYIVDDPENKSTNSYFFDVIPSKKLSFDAYNRLPIKISTMMVTDNPRGSQIYSMMFDIRGIGEISKSKKRSIEFHLRGPQKKGNPLLGFNDKYYLKYTSPKSKLILGDSNYRLSDLTEASRNGLGVRYEYHGNRFLAGGFVNYPRFYPKIRMISSVYLSSNMSKKKYVKGGYLQKFYTDQTSASLFMVSGGLKPLKWIDLELELAGGLQNGQFYKAYKTLVYTKLKNTRGHFIYTQADKDFPGFYNNSRFLSTGVSTRIKSKINISINYDLNHANMVLDTVYVNAPFSQNLNLSTDYRFKGNNRISFALYRRTREDRTEPQLFNYTEYTARMSTQNRYSKLGIHSYVEVGKVQNFLPMAEGEINNVVQANFSLTYRFKPQFSVDGFINYQMGEKYLKSDLSNYYYGASMNARLKNNLSLLISYQNNYQVEEYYRDRSLMTVSSHYTINQKHDLGFGVNYRLVKNSLDKKEFSAFFKYSYSLRLRTNKVDNIGSLKGKVLNHGVENVEDLIINLAGNYTLTDKDGNFEFPVVLNGDYYLIMDDSNTGLNTILEETGPFKVSILPGQVTEVQLAMTKSANIHGRLLVEQDSAAFDKDFIQYNEPIKNLLIEAKKEGEVFRVLSNMDGEFSFQDLRPGKWKVKIYTNGLPSQYSIVREESTIDLTLGQEYFLEVPIKQKVYKIKFQKSVK